MNTYIADLIARYPALQPCLPDIESAYELLSNSFKSSGKLLLCGNGGSASDSDHWAGELLKGFAHPRPLTDNLRQGLPENLANKLQWAFPAIPLTGFPAFNSAFSNDVEPEFIFAQLVLALGRPGDVLAAMSTSGNSPNVCRAAEVARARKIPVLALTGESGGKLRELSDICIRVPATQTPHIQEFHLPIYHCLALMLEADFIGYF